MIENRVFMEKWAGEFFLDGPKVLAVTEGYDLKISPLVPKLILPTRFIGIWETWKNEGIGYSKKKNRRELKSVK